ncbi:hypothetical protein FS749_001491 [Ceratobasidium sp. UAMH 11750]|nr:hypothetical protein FS749_001491 [Ceratobasidium sp. UAMH 11750]
MALQKIATDCEQTAQAIKRRFRDIPGTYFRFNVEQGLQDMGMDELKRLPEIVAHARCYNQTVEIGSKLEKAAHAVAQAPADTLVLAAQLGGAIVPAPHNFQMKPCPPPSIYFTGRDAVLTQIKEYFTDGSSARHVFVLHGLGGSGKTQVALKFVEQHRDCFLDIFYVDASSVETISADLKRIAIFKKAGNTKGDALAWLAQQGEKWLVVFNNADNTSLDIKQYFPVCSHGDILITTRNRQLISLAGETKRGVKAECCISGMHQEDARELFLKVSDMNMDSGAEEYTAVLIREFGYLALAIIQAGAYIRVTQCSLKEYLEMFLKNKKVLEAYNKLPKCDDYPWTVYTTWYISYERLEPQVARFLRLLGYMHHEGITEGIFQNACESLSTYRPELSADEDKTVKQCVTEFLQSSFQCTEHNSFDKLAFLGFIRELRSYSLIDFNPTDRTYSFHPLLQDWVRRIDEANSSTTLSSTALLLALSVRYDYNPGFCPCSQKSLLPHIDAVLSGSNARPCTANSFAWVYQQNQLWEAAEPLLNVSLEASKQLLGKTHPTTLYNIENLAATISHQGRWQEAETLRSEATKTCEELLGADHAHTLWAMSNLALHYSRKKQFQKAKELQHRICDAKRRTAGITHLETLQAIGNLAVTYANSNQLKRAEWLQQSVLKYLQQLAGPQHPITLTSKQHLALTYAEEKKWSEFGALQADVVQERSAVLGKEHHDTRESIAMLDWFDKNVKVPNSPPIIVCLPPTPSQENKPLIIEANDDPIVSESESDGPSNCFSLDSCMLSQETLPTSDSASSKDSLLEQEFSEKSENSDDPWPAIFSDWYRSIERIPERWVREQLRRAVEDEAQAHRVDNVQKRGREELENSPLKRGGPNTSFSRGQSPSRMAYTSNTGASTTSPQLGHSSRSSIQKRINAWREWLNPDVSEANSIRCYYSNPPLVITLIDPFSPDSPTYGRAGNVGIGDTQAKSPSLPKLVRPRSSFTNRSRCNSAASSHASRATCGPREPTAETGPAKKPESGVSTNESQKKLPVRQSSQTVTVESDSDEDDWTTGRSSRKRPM